MDIRCPVCTEPIDLDELHYIDGMTFDEARKAFYSKGCGSLFGGSGCTPDDSERGKTIRSITAGLVDMLGDDIDGIAAMEDDAEFFGYFD